MIRKLLTPRWIFTTLLVIAAVGVMIRLGIWQLDRLQQRRTFNARVEAQINAPALDLNQNLDQSQSLYDMEYRDVVVKGHFANDQTILLYNQVWENQPGFSVLTPLVIDGTDEAVLVNRGWIPLDQGESNLVGQYVVNGNVTISGKIRRSQPEPTVLIAPDPTLAPGQSGLDKWRFVNLDRIQQQTAVKLLPVYIQQGPIEGKAQPPYPSLPEVDLSEGPHMGYALQWFAFATILGLGYPFFVRKSLRKEKRRSKSADSANHGASPQFSSGTGKGR